ncbi:alpha/beta fold hydrolase [Spirosoma utsteinense]|uniref:Proline iminopeptidase n=1 Tax=Spirosoma utsteinense TaxID=2585773 RepID=A0ABR6VZN8_9BACT|nr:alpha/beta fold hydrolase [Spirosoma utsteinense]MBC3784505.1 proline iminopeptidase [Spirosoma utsteinense]MBC3789744.1 proline iminopeptidase [Spirosoma utsteinense]
MTESLLTQKRRTESGKLIYSGSQYRIWLQQTEPSDIKLLIIPGGPGNNHTGYAPFSYFLPPKGVQVYIVDMVDCGLSDRTNNPAFWTLTNYVKDIEQIRKELGVEQLYLLGHSFGGAIALEYAYAFPQAVKGLIVSNMSYSTEAVGINTDRFVDSLAAHDATVQGLRTQAKSLESSSNLYSKLMAQSDSLAFNLLSHSQTPSIGNSLPELATFQEAAHSSELNDASQKIYQHFINSGELMSWNFEDRMHRLRMPVLILAGDQDYALSVSDAAFMKQHIPKAEVTICPEGGHIMFWTNRDCYYPSLLKFINGVEQKK